MERVPFILLAQYFSILPDFNLVFFIRNYSYPLIVLHRVYTYFLRILKVFNRKTCMLHVQPLPNSDSGLALFPFLTSVLTDPLPTLTPHQSHYIHHHLAMFIRNVHKRCTNSGEPYLEFIKRRRPGKCLLSEMSARTLQVTV